MKELGRYFYQVFRKSVFELSKRGYKTTAYRANAEYKRSPNKFPFIAPSTLYVLVGAEDSRDNNWMEVGVAEQPFIELLSYVITSKNKKKTFMKLLKRLDEKPTPNRFVNLLHFFKALKFSYEKETGSIKEFEILQIDNVAMHNQANASVVRMKLEKEQALYQACLDKAEFHKQNIKMYEASLLNGVKE